MEALPVHIAVLSIADDAASADHATSRAISETAAAAGHQIVDEEIVRDEEAAIRDQLVRWISHDNVDVVIVAAAVESEAASAALAPLIMATLPGFTDLFRWLTFQEIGASAMLSAAEAAQCQGTFVFVLPAHAGAVRAAMDKLILPQLDVRTTPKNLIGQMPRLRDAAKRFVLAAPPMAAATPHVAQPRPDTEPEAVPQHVPPQKEKTQDGPGLTPRPPAVAPTRQKPRTANTIARKTDDPPTKPIDLAKLEKQIQLSTQNDALTKQIDLKAHDAQTKVVDMSAHQAKTRVVDGNRMLPRVPPGADELTLDDDPEGLTFTAPPRGNPATQAMPGSVRSPAPVGISKPPTSTATPAFATPISRSTPPHPRQAVATPPPSPVVPARQQTRTPAAGMQARQDPRAGAPRGASPPIALTRDMAITPVKPTPVVQPRGATPPIALTRDMAITPVKPTPVATEAKPPRDTAVTPVPPPPIQVNPRTPPSPAWGPPTSSDDDEARTVRAPSKRPPITNPEEETPTTRDDDGPTILALTADEARTTPAMTAVADPSRQPPGPNAAELWARAVAPITEPARPAAAVDEPAPMSPGSNLFAQSARTPTTEHDPLAGVTQQPIGVVDLSHSDFVYPLKGSRSRLLLKLLLAAAVLAGGFFAFVMLFPGEDKPSQTASVAPTPPPEPPAPVAKPPEPTPAPPPPPEQKPEEVKVETPPTPPPEPPPPPPTETKTNKSTTKTNKSTHKSTTPPPGEGSDATAEQVEPKPKTEPKPKETEVAAEGCDEVACVMSKYEKPCCERFKPSDGFTPKNVVPDELDRSMVKAGVEKIKARVVACGEKNSAKGTVRLAVTVDDEGTVKSVSVTEAPDAALGECVASAMRAAKFGRSAKGGEFNYPFVF